MTSDCCQGCPDQDGKDSPSASGAEGLPWRSSGWGSVLSLPKTQVQYPVGELRSNKLSSTANKEKKKNNDAAKTGPPHS